MIDYETYKFIEVNDAARENLGYSQKELELMTPWQLEPEYPKDRFIALTNKLKSQESKLLSFTTPHKRKDGSHYPAEVHLQVSQFSGRTVFLAIVLDQTENQQLQSQVLHNSKLATIGELAAGVGHEINNPLAVINGNIKKMQRQNSSPSDEFLSAYEKCQYACERIKQIVLGLRTFARFDDSEQEPFDLAKSVDQTVGLIREIYEGDGIHVEWNPPESGPYLIKGNGGRIQQAVMNVLQNARDAVSDSEEKNLVVSLAKMGDEVEIAIKDTGNGIPKHVQPRIFDPFYSTKSVGKGTGIGLSLTANVVKESGGAIGFETSPVGTIFRFRFPLYHGVPEVAGDDVTSMHPSYGLKVLVVDDEPNVRELLKDCLEDLGCQVVEAEDGIEALKFLDREDFDCLFTDMKMPRMDGLSLLKQVEAQNKNPSMFLFVVTGGVASDFSQNGKNEVLSLIDGYCLKPFDMNALIQMLDLSLHPKEKKAYYLS